MPITSWLERRTISWAILAAALLLAAPALWTGWQFDDYIHRDLLSAQPGLAGLSVATQDLFSFLSGDQATTLEQIEHGTLAWWTLPNAHQAFFRPLSGLTHWLDYQLWPSAPWLMHLHSLLWFALLILAVSRFYRALMPSMALAALATLLYALDDARGYAVAWIANRNALCSTLFGILALLAHIHWRSSKRWADLALAMLWLCVALLSGEAAIGAFAYLVAYALWLDTGSWQSRLGSLLPAALVILLWRVGYGWLGYGAYGTAYLDPGSEPLAYLQQLPIRAVLLLLGQWSPLPAEVMPFLPPNVALMLLIGGLLFLSLIGWLLLPLLRESALARFWATGMLLALLPAATALPANRLLFWVGLGAMGLLGMLVLPILQKAATSLTPRRLGVSLIGLHLILGPLALPLTAYSPALLGNTTDAIATLPADPASDQRELIVIAAPSLFSLSLIDQLRADTDQPMRTLLLAAGHDEVEVSRMDEYSLAIISTDGYLRGFDSIFRAPWHPLRLGSKIILPNVTISIMDLTADGRPAAVAFRFPKPLEHPSYAWYTWQAGAYQPFGLPKVSNTTLVNPLAEYGRKPCPSALPPHLLGPDVLSFIDATSLVKRSYGLCETYSYHRVPRPSHARSDPRPWAS